MAGSRPRLTAYAVLGVLCCLLRKNGIYAVVPMLLASAFTVSEKRLRRPGDRDGNGGKLPFSLLFPFFPG